MTYTLGVQLKRGGKELAHPGRAQSRHNVPSSGKLSDFHSFHRDRCDSEINDVDEAKRDPPDIQISEASLEKISFLWHFRPRERGYLE